MCKTWKKFIRFEVMLVLATVSQIIKLNVDKSFEF